MTDQLGLDIDGLNASVRESMIAAGEDEEAHHHGAPPPPIWHSSTWFEGHIILTARRPELTGDALDALVDDLTAWVDWLVVTFRQQSRIPPCWVRHGGLREELLALFFFWQHSWLPAREATMPAAFMRELDLTLNRIDRLWKVPCDATTHNDPAPVQFASNGVPSWTKWWSHPQFSEHEAVIAELQATSSRGES